MAVLLPSRFYKAMSQAHWASRGWIISFKMSALCITSVTLLDFMSLRFTFRDSQKRSHEVIYPSPSLYLHPSSSPPAQKLEMGCFKLL